MEIQRQTGLASDGAAELRAGGGVDGPVAELARDIVERFASVTVDDVRGRYAIGKLLLSQEVPVTRLASIVGCSSKALYQYGVVVKRFCEEELNYWLARRNVQGQPPSWSHFVLLCSVPSRAARHAILEQWLENPLGIRELTAQLRLQNHGAAPIDQQEAI